MGDAQSPHHHHHHDPLAGTSHHTIQHHYGKAAAVNGAHNHHAFSDTPLLLPKLVFKTTPFTDDYELGKQLGR